MKTPDDPSTGAESLPHRLAQRCRRLVMGCAVALLLIGAAAPAQSLTRDPRRSRLGLTAGSPQTLAITYEYALVGALQLQANVGSVIFYSSVSGRVLALPDQWRVQPYLFLGGGALYSINYEQMDGDGWTGFTWFGAGIRLRLGRFRLFGELGSIDNLNESKDYETHYSTAAVGILITI